MTRLLVILLAAAACGADEARHEFHRPLMGTHFTIVCYTADGRRAAEAARDAFEVAGEIDRAASDYLADSELLALSKAQVGTPVEVSATLFPILAAARGVAEKTGGAYDPTLGPLTQLWRRTRKTGALPPPAELAAAKSACGWRNFTLDADARTITLMKPGMRFDLGGIAKGHAADRMLETMASHGITRTCIVAGGDVRVGSPPPGRAAWTVGLRTFDTNTPQERLSVSDCAVSTSGDLYQFVEIDGRRYSHILDPETGLGLTERIAVSVVAPTATLSDALATAACVAGREKAEEMATNAGATGTRVRTP